MSENEAVAIPATTKRKYTRRNVTATATPVRTEADEQAHFEFHRDELAKGFALELVKQQVALGRWDHVVVAQHAYRYADAMLREKATPFDPKKRVVTSAVNPAPAQDGALAPGEVTVGEMMMNRGANSGLNGGPMPPR